MVCKILTDSTVLKLKFDQREMREIPMGCVGTDMIRIDFYIDEYVDGNIFKVKKFINRPMQVFLER